MSKFELTKSQRQRLFAVVIPSGSGKTTLTNELQKYKHKNGKSHIFIDLDDFANKKIKNIDEILSDANHRDIRLFPVLRTEIVKVLDQYATSIVVVVTGNPDFVRFMGIKDKRATICVPTRDFAKELYETIKTKEDIEISDLEASREKVLASYNKNTYSMYNSISSLVAIVTNVFSLVLSEVPPTPRGSGFFSFKSSSTSATSSSSSKDEEKKENKK